MEKLVSLMTAVQVCAAVGMPDGYAGELPVAFATLIPGASVTEAELLAFTARGVDEAPAKPKSVTIITSMPMTNVGKIYKPELRLMAAQAAVTAMLTELCRAANVPEALQPGITAAEASGITVTFAGVLSAPTLHEQVRTALHVFPFKTLLVWPDLPAATG